MAPSQLTLSDRESSKSRSQLLKAYTKKVSDKAAKMSQMLFILYTSGESYVGSTMLFILNTSGESYVGSTMALFDLR